MSAEVVEKEGALDAHVREMVSWHFSAREKVSVRTN
jgi:hypothetical protein